MTTLAVCVAASENFTESEVQKTVVFIKVQTLLSLPADLILVMFEKLSEIICDRDRHDF